MASQVDWEIVLDCFLRNLTLYSNLLQLILVATMSIKVIKGYTIYLKKCLGEGAYGKVCEGLQERTKLPVAIKMIDKTKINKSQYLKDALQKEIFILQKLNCDNIVKVYEVLESPNNIYIVQELCDYDLEGYIKKNKEITFDMAMDFLKQVCNAFVHLVREGIVHRDIKPANILVKNGVFKLGDFGFAKNNVTANTQNDTVVGTPLYMPIELYLRKPYTSKADIWAVGLIFYELLHTVHPFYGPSVMLIINNILNKPLKVDPKFSPETQDFLKKTLGIYQKDRLSWDEVFSHPIFKGSFDFFHKENKVIENKMKAIINKLRFTINSQNFNLLELLNDMGFNQMNKELSFQQFFKFLNTIDPELVENEARYLYDKIDTDGNGLVSVQEIENEMSRNYINVNGSAIRLDMGDDEQDKKEKGLKFDIQLKMQDLFVKLNKWIKHKSLSLKKVFDSHDEGKKGKMSFESFKTMVVKHKNDFAEDEVREMFRYFDKDNSNTIEYNEILGFYCEVNKIEI